MLVLEGSGTFTVGAETVNVAAGDILAVPGSIGASARAAADGLRFYYVDDSPLTRYMGWQVQPTERIVFTHWPAALLAQKLADTAAEGITAALVCQDLRGNAGTLTCVYHQWAYDSRGELIGVPFRKGLGSKGGYPADFDLKQHGL